MVCENALVAELKGIGNPLREFRYPRRMDPTKTMEFE
jgi:hypothetical protein